MQTSGFAELPEMPRLPVLPVLPERRAVRAPGGLRLDVARFARRIERCLEQGVLLMAAPLTCQTLGTRDDEDRTR